MIRKYLIVSKQLFISATKVEDEQGNIYNIDLLMPLDVYWEIKSEIKNADYILASRGEISDVQAIYRKICQKAAAYAVYEHDRFWLVKKFGQ